MQKPAWLPIHAAPTHMGRAMDLGGADNSNVGLIHGPQAGGEDDFREKAAFIVMAANLHHDLVEALKDAEELLSIHFRDANPVRVGARAALSKVEG